MGEDDLNVIGACSRLHNEVEDDRHEQLGLDLKRGFVNEDVQRLGHRTVDQVLDGDDAGIGHAGFDGNGDRRVGRGRQQLGLGRVAHRCFFAKGACGPKEGELHVSSP